MCIRDRLRSIPVTLIEGYSNFGSVPNIVRLAKGTHARVVWLQPTGLAIDPTHAIRRYG